MNDVQLFKRNLDVFYNLDRPLLKTKIHSNFRDFISSNAIQLFYVEILPKYLKELGCSVLKQPNGYYILLDQSQLIEISEQTKTPINYVINVAVCHEISHVIADAFQRFDDEDFIWQLGSTMLQKASIPEYFYTKIKNYLRN
ncbi:hypothetical protein H6G80_03960 [Nostoc sp. FACHB-87]|uniref:hypothetical protein n=1 Tax=Nostocaceae TaxID=1162 RepID=UPI001683265B|nr:MULTISPECIES: hypothetical protein [Nostocaceae]MBD2298942.1 hypothetical protein [Nostoc sp. FACHB-190]MBD2453230.1 hypothetical protein [Nostoc sp. FACHB-87]MBD2474990.1 hypothetical protein [Anabaena sp. FACHB-83]